MEKKEGENEDFGGGGGGGVGEGEAEEYVPFWNLVLTFADFSEPSYAFVWNCEVHLMMLPKIYT